MNVMPSDTSICVVTGASGFVGSALKRCLQGAGWRVVSWRRNPGSETEAVAFHLGQEVDPRRLQGVRALVHCAYDFGPLKREDIAATNVIGSQKLFHAARLAGVQSVVFVSSLSAFPGCRSLYGQAKLQIERHAESVGAFVIRPGLVYGDEPGGMFGRLVRQVQHSRWMPILWGGSQVQYLAHYEDLADLVRGCLAGRVPGGTGPVVAAHEQGWQLKEILAQIALALERRISFVPVPWPFAWFGLKALEMAGVPGRFRSDSLIGLVYQDPHPSFTLLKSLGFQFRPFQPPPALLKRATAGP